MSDTPPEEEDFDTDLSDDHEFPSIEEVDEILVYLEDRGAGIPQPEPEEDEVT